MGLQKTIRLTVGVALLLLANGASAQDNLDQGKSGPQLFASNCAVCHKTPEGLSKAGGMFGVQSFLREHYTTSKETAAAIAAYIEGVDRSAGARQRSAPPKRAASGKPAAKKQDAKQGDSSAEKKVESKAEPKAEAKPVESSPVEAKPVEAKPVEAKPVEAKPSEAKPADAPASEKAD